MKPLFLFFLSIVSPSEFEEFNEFEEYEEELSVIEEVKEEEITPVLSELEQLFHRYAKQGSITIDVGAREGASTITLAQCVGPQGQVVSIEPNPYLFHILTQNLEQSKIANATLYKEDVSIDALNLNNVSLIKIEADGDEDLVLDEAKELIHREKPVLIVQISAGIPLESADRYVKEEYEARMQQLRLLGYTLQRLQGGYAVALPN